MLFEKQVSAVTSPEERKNGRGEMRPLHIGVSPRMSIRRPEDVKFRSKDETRAAEALKEEVEREGATGSAQDKQKQKRDNSAGAAEVEVNLQSFEILGMMGSGSYGKVFLCQKTKTGKFYALKAISKQKIMQDKKQHEVFRERQALIMLDHPSIVRMHWSFNVSLESIVGIYFKKFYSLI